MVRPWVTERHHDGGLIVRYLGGQKEGPLIYFFSATQLGALVANHLIPVLLLRLQRTRRVPP